MAKTKEITIKESWNRGSCPVCFSEDLIYEEELYDHEIIWCCSCQKSYRLEKEVTKVFEIIEDQDATDERP